MRVGNGLAEVGVVGVIGALLGSQDMHHACSGVWLALTARPRTIGSVGTRIGCCGCGCGGLVGVWRVV